MSGAGRHLLDATYAAAKFKPSIDAKSMAQQFAIHVMVVTEHVDAEKVVDAMKVRT